jgi:hypothetical protein
VAATVGGSVRGPGASTINAKNINSGPPGRWCRRSGSAHHQHKKCQRCPPPLGGGVGGPGPPTINAKNINGGPMGIGAGYPGAPNINKKISTAGLLGGDARGLGAPTINAKNIDGGPPRRRCQRSESTHNQCKCRR